MAEETESVLLNTKNVIEPKNALYVYHSKSYGSIISQLF